ncbi:MAG: phosphate ABC transporter permease subunit PstC [Magnetococcales bacterium]|nr:phosphate ABC transporter permease subunit PstC [Magnetococcales bacterium]
MFFPHALSLLSLLSIVGFLLGRRRALSWTLDCRAHSRPPYHGLYVALHVLLPGLAVILLFALSQTAIVQQMIPGDLLPGGGADTGELNTWLERTRRVAEGSMPAQDGWNLDAAVAQYRSWSRNIGLIMLALALAAGLAGLLRSLRALEPALRSRPFVETTVKVVLTMASTLSFLITIGIVLSLLFEALRFFEIIPAREFLFGLKWNPQTAIRADQVGGSGTFGVVPLLTGTWMITGIAMFIAAPVGLFSAIYLSEFATPGARGALKPALEILAGIPTVVYGFFAALAVAPFISHMGTKAGLEVASESALAAGLVMGIMIIPFVSSLSDDVINAVPQALRDGSLALGATHAETIRHVVLPAALPGIVGAMLLAISRAVGETMIVVMAAGLAANLTANPLEAMTTVTVQIVTLLVGDQEFDSAKTLSAFALGLALFLFTLVLNIIALGVVKRYHEKI